MFLLVTYIRGSQTGVHDPPGVHFDFLRGTLGYVFYYLMLIIRVKIKAAPIGRVTKKSPYVFRCPVYPGLPFRASVFIFEFVAEKTGLFGC